MGQPFARPVAAGYLPSFCDFHAQYQNHLLPRRQTMISRRRAGYAGLMIATLILAAPTAGAATTDATATQLLGKYNCTACHAVDKKLVGPSYMDVAAKYAGDAAAPAKLAQKVKTGGSGVWGAIPMPPNNVPDADLKSLVEWILARK
jgi:cytochrome c